MHPLTRRTFMQIGAGSVAAGAAGKINLLEPAALWGAGRAVAPSDRVRFASIGTGTRGCELLKHARGAGHRMRSGVRSL
jgi:hypothetical protein